MSAEADGSGDVDSAAASNVDRVDADGSASVERICERLHDVVDPCSAATGSNLDIVEMGLVKSVAVDGGDVAVEMRLTSPMCHMVPYFYEEIEGRLGDLDGVEDVDLETDAGFEWSEALMTEAATEKRQALLDEQAARYESERTERASPSN